MTRKQLVSDNRDLAGSIQQELDTRSLSGQHHAVATQPSPPPSLLHPTNHPSFARGVVSPAPLSRSLAVSRAKWPAIKRPAGKLGGRPDSADKADSFRDSQPRRCWLSSSLTGHWRYSLSFPGHGGSTVVICPGACRNCWHLRHISHCHCLGTVTKALLGHVGRNSRTFQWKFVERCSCNKLKFVLIWRNSFTGCCLQTVVVYSAESLLVDDSCIGLHAVFWFWEIEFIYCLGLITNYYTVVLYTVF